MGIDVIYVLKATTFLLVTTSCLIIIFNYFLNNLCEHQLAFTITRSRGKFVRKNLFFLATCATEVEHIRSLTKYFIYFYVREI